MVENYNRSLASVHNSVLFDNPVLMEFYFRVNRFLCS